ncbi:MAG: 30S ribosomal protein THX [Bacteroidales bacterium]|nr:30S ribosomal protein THX [Bacteroidales bacterium]
MGKGDKKTRRGKITKGSYGKHRMRKGKTQEKYVAPVIKEEAKEEVAVVVEKKPAAKKTAAKKASTTKKEVTKKAAPKKTTTAKKTTTKAATTKKATTKKTTVKAKKETKADA